MTESLINLFKSAAWMKELNALRKKVKQQEIKLTIKNDKEKVQQTIELKRYLPETTNIDATVSLKMKETDKKTVYLESLGINWRKEHELFYEVFKAIQKASQNIGCEFVIVYENGYYKEPCYNHFDMFQKVSEYPGEGYPHSLVGSFSEPLYGSIEPETCFYIPLIDGILERKVAIVDYFRNELKRQQEMDITFTIKKLYINSNHIWLFFYYEGFTGQIVLCYDGNNTFGYDSDNVSIFLDTGESMFERNTIKEIEVIDINDIPRIINEMIEYAKEQKALPNLLEPPREHFNNYCQQKFTVEFPKKMVFSLLEQEMSAKEVEKAILQTTLEPSHIYDYNRKVHIANLLNRYFVCSINTGESYMFMDKEEALKKYDEILQKIERMKYEKGLEEVREKVKEAIIGTK